MHSDRTRAARLTIHAGGEADATGRRVTSHVQRLRALYQDAIRHDDRAPLNIRIVDARGSLVLDVEDAAPKVDVDLPEGTYRIAVRLGRKHRRYMMTLMEGAPLDLYLRLASRA